MSNAPLTAAEIEEIKALVGNHYTTWESDDKEAAATYLARLLSMLTPPPDAAVRAAVKNAEELLDGVHVGSSIADGLKVVRIRPESLRTILRAVQAPRLTPAQIEAIQVAASLLKGKNGDRAWARRKLEAAFPEAFEGEAGK
jgi:hypothetical protein